MKNENPWDVREIRRKTGLNQSEFWSRLGVTQSGGSRYETGRRIPKPVEALLRLIYVEKVDITRVSGDDVRVLEYLKANDPELFKNLKKQAKAKPKKA